MAVTSLFLSVVAIIFSSLGFIPGVTWACYIGLIAGIVGIILAAVAMQYHRKEGQKGMMALWGLVISIIAVLEGIISLIVAMTRPIM